MAETNYETILKTKWDEIPEPELLPDGSYRLKGQSAKLLPPKTEGNSPQVLIVDQPIEASDDVTDLADDHDFADDRIFTRFWVGNARDWQNLRRHLAMRGIDTDGLSPEETLAKVKGSEVMGYVTTRVYEGNNGVQEENVVSNFSPVED